MSKNNENIPYRHWTTTKKAKSFFTITGNRKEPTKPRKPSKKTNLEKMRERSKELNQMTMSNLRRQLDQNIKDLSPNKNQNPILGFIKRSKSYAKNNKNETSMSKRKTKPRPWNKTRRAELKKRNPAAYSEQQARLNRERT